VILSVRPERPPIAVIGVGNALMQDDGFGPAMIARLEARGGLPASVELVDVGTAGFDLMHQLLGRTHVLLLDAVAGRAGDAPGTMAQLPHAQLVAMPRHGARASPHEPGVLAAIQVAALAGELPRELLLVGVVPGSMAMGTELTEPVRRAMNPAEAIVRRAVQRWASGQPYQTAPRADASAVAAAGGDAATPHR
jgi:hydrogenase maturation protease